MYSKTDGIKSVFVFTLVNELQCLCCLGDFFFFLDICVVKYTIYICMCFMDILQSCQMKNLDFLLSTPNTTVYCIYCGEEGTSSLRECYVIRKLLDCILSIFWYPCANEKFRHTYTGLFCHIAYIRYDVPCPLYFISASCCI